MLVSIKGLRVCACGAELEAEVLRQARGYQQQQAAGLTSDALFNFLVQAGMSVQVGAVTHSSSSSNSSYLFRIIDLLLYMPSCSPVLFFTATSSPVSPVVTHPICVCVQ